MKHMYILLFFICTAMLALPNYTGYSGATGSSGTCASSCHGSGTGTITVLGLSSEYEPLKTYTVIVTHTSGSSIVNFNASTRVGSSSNVAGTFATLSNTLTYSVSSENGVHASTNNIDTAKFLWTAPESGTGGISFSVSGLQGSKNGTNKKVIITMSEGVATDIQENESVPLDFKLEQNYPNPFNPTTRINYTITKQSNVSLVVFDALGREITTLLNKEQPQGNYEVEFDASNLTSGVYFYKIIAGNFVETKKMLLLR